MQDLGEGGEQSGCWLPPVHLRGDISRDEHFGRAKRPPSGFSSAAQGLGHLSHDSFQSLSGLSSSRGGCQGAGTGTRGAPRRDTLA